MGGYYKEGKCKLIQNGLYNTNHTKPKKPREHRSIIPKEEVIYLESKKRFVRFFILLYKLLYYIYINFVLRACIFDELEICRNLQAKLAGRSDQNLQ